MSIPLLYFYILLKIDLWKRQRDEKFVSLLNDVRQGSPTKATIDVLMKCDVKYQTHEQSKTKRVKSTEECRNSSCSSCSGGGESEGCKDSNKVVATKLFSKNSEVDKVNALELEQLPGI